MFAYRKTKKRITGEINPDEIFLDSRNLPNFDTHQFEGRIERPISSLALSLFGGALALICLLLIYKTFSLQVINGTTHREQTENNRLAHEIIFPDRGVIYDRTGKLLVWNEVAQEDDSDEFSHRAYATSSGLSHIIGQVSYPKKDSSGFYFQKELVGVSGIESAYDNALAGIPGMTILEEDAHGAIISSSLMTPPQPGEPLVLTIDAAVQDALASQMSMLADEVGFVGGASVIMDIHTGEILAMVSVPGYDLEAISKGDGEVLAVLTTDPRTPFLNRAIGGRYTPGSIIKPFVAIGALMEHVIDPAKEIYSDGALRIPNPYNPDKPTIMKDWKAHGWTDIRHAIAVSSDVYFYTVGGGFGDQKGLGIDHIDKYVRLFKIGEPTGIDIAGEVGGTIPTIAWKKEHFPDDPWRVGDTYNTAIGQYGFQVTPVQMVRAVAAIANDGLLVTPHLVMGTTQPIERIPVDHDALQVVREGMRLAVTTGTAKALDIPIAIAGKTGTAELGVSKQMVNSWIVGFWPYENPQYAFATVMERGPVTNLVGSASVMRRVFDWMRLNTPQYFEEY